MRTSNLFPLARRYSKQKARSRVQSTTNGGKLLTGLFLFCCGYSRGKKEKCDVSIFLSCTHKKIERGVCFQYNVFCIEARIEFFLRTPLKKCSLTADDGASPPLEWCTASAEMVHGGRGRGAPGRHAGDYSGMPLRLRMDSPSIWMV